MLRLICVSATTIKTFSRQAAFSTTPLAASHALDKLKNVLREYRLANFDHSLPKRYVKEFVRGVDKNHDHFLEKEDFLSFLNAIGASDKLTSKDLDEALHEILANASMPNDSCRLPDDVMESIMLDGIRREEM